MDSDLNGCASSDVSPFIPSESGTSNACPNSDLHVDTHDMIDNLTSISPADADNYIDNDDDITNVNDDILLLPIIWIKRKLIKWQLESHRDTNNLLIGKRILYVLLR